MCVVTIIRETRYWICPTDPLEKRVLGELYEKKTFCLYYDKEAKEYFAYTVRDVQKIEREMKFLIEKIIAEEEPPGFTAEDAIRHAMGIITEEDMKRVGGGVHGKRDD